MKCVVCLGDRVIRLPIRYLLDVHQDYQEGIDPSYKDYPCPECQQVFYRDDLIHVNAVEPQREQFKDKPDYITHIKKTIARVLGMVAFANGGVHFETLADKHYNFEGFIALKGDMFIVRASAKGWRK